MPMMYNESAWALTECLFADGSLALGIAVESLPVRQAGPEAREERA